MGERRSCAIPEQATARAARRRTGGPRPPAGRPRPSGACGQASVEWVAALLVVVVVLGGGAALAGGLLAPGLARTIRCAVLTRCHGEDARLARAYAPDVAAALRAYAPSFDYERGTLTLPVDFRTCRSHACSDAPATPGREVVRTDAGRRATVFTHAIDRRASGGSLYLQYWLYYPDSTWHGSGLAAAHALAGVPGVLGDVVRAPANAWAGHHADDWEQYGVRIDPDGRIWARASAHHGYAGRRARTIGEKLQEIVNEAPSPPRPLPRPERTAAWTPITGWTHVTRGSHAGFIVPGPGGDRRTGADAVRLVPIELLGDADRATSFPMTPPWRKAVYADPEATGT